MFKSIAALLLGSASAKASVNENYKIFLHGVAPMTHEVFE